MEKNYNGVTIERSWSFVAFAQEFGTPKLAKCVNHETGEEFNAVAFENPETKDITFCHFGYSTAGMSAKEISQQKDSLKVGLNSNGKYSLYKQDGAWETIDL
jgi:hypothetical protein